MGQEIERKFLVKDDSYKLEAYAHSHIVQGYICSARGRDVYKRQGGFGKDFTGVRPYINSFRRVECVDC